MVDLATYVLRDVSLCLQSFRNMEHLRLLMSWAFEQPAKRAELKRARLRILAT